MAIALPQRPMAASVDYGRAWCIVKSSRRLRADELFEVRMANNLSQDKRIATLTTSLGKDQLVIKDLDFDERISSVFEYRLTAYSAKSDVKFDSIIGTNAAVILKASGSLERKFNGVVVEAHEVGTENDLTVCELVLRPWLWLLSHTRNCKIFEKKTVKEIIKAVFDDAGFKDYSDKTTESYPQIEYCVQYRESSMNFVCRLMEEFGIYFYFEHADDKHTLIMVDAKSSLKTIPGLSNLLFLPHEAEFRRDREFVRDWVIRRSFQSGRVALKDYNYLKPNADMLSKDSEQGSYSHADLEIFDYPGRYIEKSDGDKLAKVKLQAEQAKDQRRRAAGNAMALYPGGLVTLEKHPSVGENTEYLVLGCRHVYHNQAYRSTSAANVPPYRGEYELLPSSRPFRAPQETPKPAVHGPQTAKVVCKDGEEIDVDKYGRITVQFYWNRESTISRRVRIAQVWSGKAWGGIVIPRKDQEVVVQFLEGDPDQPLVIGTVYNDENKPPYDLPANKTIAGVKSESTKGGGGYNELIFEDKKGDEEIKVHAEKDLDVTVEHDETRDIGNDQTEKIGNNLTIKVGNNETIDVGNSYSLTAMTQIKLNVGMSTITMTPGSITIDSPSIIIKGTAVVTTSAPMVTTNADGAIIMNSSGVITATAQMTTIAGGKCPMPPLATPALTVF
jgi:type VI secretion system secreted protein VgrG